LDVFDEQALLIKNLSSRRKKQMVENKIPWNPFDCDTILSESPFCQVRKKRVGFTQWLGGLVSRYRVEKWEFMVQSLPAWR